MRILALIPARGGSKRIPGKNIKLLGGKPLVVWSIETALALKLPCYVSTDSRVIADISRQAGAQVIQRPAELASDTATDWDVIHHALGEVEADLVVYLRPTSPFRKSEVVQSAIDFMTVNYDGKTDLMRSVHEMSESIYKMVFEIFPGDGPKFFYPGWSDKPNQECPKSYAPNGYVDIFKAEMFQPGAKWAQSRHWFETEPIVELDTIEQWEYAEWRIGKGYVPCH